MKNFVLTCIALFSILTVFAQQPLEGIWQTNDDNTLIETYQKDGAWYGKIKSSDNPKATIGMDILKGFTEKDGVWNGQLYAVKKNETLNAVITPDANKLNIVLTKGVITKKLVWTKQE